MADDDFGMPLPIPTGLDWADEPADDSSSLCDVELTQLGERKISVIKAVREYTGLGLADAKRLVESAPTNLGVSVSREVAGEIVRALKDAGAAACIAGERAPTSSGFAKVVLTDHGPRKIAVIKLIREVTGLGLKEAKELAETRNATILEGVTVDRAGEILDKITAQHGLAFIEGAEAPAVVGVEDHVTLVLTFTGAKKINVIKIIREASGLGLRECKDMSENVPAVVSERLTRDRAERALAELREVGAEGRIEG